MRGTRQRWWILRTRIGRPAPSPATLKRIEQAVRDEVDPHPPTAAASGRHRLGKRSVMVGAGALIAVSAAVAGGLLLSQQEPSVNISDDGQAGLAESPYLRGAPWLFQRSGSTHVMAAPPLRAIEFPRGTSYPSALLQLARSVIEEGAIPARSVPVAALPKGAVWRRGTRTHGPRLSLVAPFGYTVPRGRVQAPSLRFPGSMAVADVMRIGRAIADGVPIGKGAARGVRLDVPRLRPCQIVSPPRAYRACTLAPVPARASR